MHNCVYTNSLLNSSLKPTHPNNTILPFFCTLHSNSRYLIVKEDKTLESYGLNAVCTHLGCVVPWSAPNNKFMCPCHGSQVRIIRVLHIYGPVS